VASASASDSLNCAVSRASSGLGEGRKIKDALLARERVEQVDDFAGRVKVKRADRISMTCCAIRGATALRTPPTKCAGRALFDEDATPCAPSVLSATRTKLARDSS